MRDYIQLLRPAQWVKNGFVFFALIFSNRRGEPIALLLTLGAFGVFCLLSSAVYAFNDIKDHREDALHPTKQFRPIARGAITTTAAGVVCLVLLAMGLFGAYLLDSDRTFLTTVLLYLAINLFYSQGAKRVALLDVILVASGFVLRALGGAQVINVEVSAWLVICTFTLCLFLGFGKRRCEIAMLTEAGGDVSRHRQTLAYYTPDLLNHLLSTTAVLAFLTFLLYTLDPHTTRFRPLFFTTPLVLYALFRYALVIERGQRTGPTDILIKDRPFFWASVVWTLFALLIAFRGPQIERYLPRLRWPWSEAHDAARYDQRTQGSNVQPATGGPPADAAGPG